MVQLLEQRLGVPLFERKANGLTLTAAGRAYQAGLTPILDQLESVLRRVPCREDRRPEALDVTVRVAGDRPDVVRRRHAPAAIAEAAQDDHGTEI